MKGTVAQGPLLAEGFRQVDNQHEEGQRRCLHCLQFIKSNPEFLRVRDRAFEWLDLSSSHMTVVDVGCGAGFDTLVLGDRLRQKAGSRVIGVDLSNALLGTARQRLKDAGEGLPVTFVLGDARTLSASPDLPMGMVDRVYMERTLQHIPRNECEVVAEQILRTLKPAGLFVSVEPNWELFTLRSKDVSITRSFHDYWVDRFNHGQVAMNLPPILRSAGFTDISTELQPVVFSDFSGADLVYDITNTLREMGEKGRLETDRIGPYLRSLMELGDDFYCCLMMAITKGRKPRN